LRETKTIGCRLRENLFENQLGSVILIAPHRQNITRLEQHQPRILSPTQRLADPYDVSFGGKRTGRVDNRRQSDNEQHKAQPVHGENVMALSLKWASVTDAWASTVSLVVSATPSPSGENSGGSAEKALISILSSQPREKIEMPRTAMIAPKPSLVVELFPANR
jgi:hypothetical protein